MTPEQRAEARLYAADRWGAQVLITGDGCEATPQDLPPLQMPIRFRTGIVTISPDPFGDLLYRPDPRDPVDADGFSYLELKRGDA